MNSNRHQAPGDENTSTTNGPTGGQAEEGELEDMRGELNEEAIAIGEQIQQESDALVAMEGHQEQREARRMNRIGAPTGDGTTLFLAPNTLF